MTNRQAVERFGQEAHEARIERLIWVASQLDQQSDLEDFLQDIPDHDFEEQLPDIFKSKYFEEYRDDKELSQAMIDKGYFGFLAEVNIPTWERMSFDEKGRSSSWGVTGGVYRVVFVYGETPTQVLKQIEKIATRLFREFEKAERQRLKDFPKSA